MKNPITKQVNEVEHYYQHREVLPNQFNYACEKLRVIIREYCKLNGIEEVNNIK